jgi:hypothetical protein
MALMAVWFFLGREYLSSTPRCYVDYRARYGLKQRLRRSDWIRMRPAECGFPRSHLLDYYAHGFTMVLLSLDSECIVLGSPLCWELEAFREVADITTPVSWRCRFAFRLIIRSAWRFCVELGV